MPLVSQALFVTLVTDSPRAQRIREYATGQGVMLVEAALEDFLAQPQYWLAQSSHVLALCDSPQLTKLIDLARRLDFSLGLVPLEGQVQLQEWLRIPSALDDAIALALDDQPRTLDVLQCNGEVVLGAVTLGQLPFVDQRSRSYRARQQSPWRRLLYRLALLWSSLLNLWRIHPFAVQLTTGREQTVKTAITGLLVIENNIGNAAARLINTRIGVQDGKVSSIIIAPKSVSEYLAFLCTSLFGGERQVSRLPESVSYIRSDRLRIDSSHPLRYFIDGRRREAASLELELLPAVLRLNVSEAYQALRGERQTGKDSLKIEHLPQKQERLEMIQQHLPLFTRALEEDFRDLFLQLRENARAHSSFIALMVLSAIVASLGLFLSSPAVIIGAMVLAPLMAPIVSLAMALLRGDRDLLRRALGTIAIGVALALTTAALIALIIPIERVTGEIAARLHPNLLDLGVAVASGSAGAYAHARESVTKSLPGVAIAVALVPPLCVAGIGIGWLDGAIIFGAGLLFITNLVGIALSAALTFLALGYAPIVKAKRGLAVSLVLLAVVAVPLSWAFNNIYRIWQVEQLASQGPFQINGKTLSLSDLQVRLTAEGPLLRADVNAHNGVFFHDLKALKAELERRLGRPLQLEVTPRIQL